MSDRVGDAEYRRQMRSTVAGLERRIGTLEAERNAAFAARDAAEKAVRDMNISHDRRVGELLEATNREVERRRVAEKRAGELQTVRATNAG